jgi:hypothetical protein
MGNSSAYPLLTTGDLAEAYALARKLLALPPVGIHIAIYVDF